MLPEKNLRNHRLAMVTGSPQLKITIARFSGSPHRFGDHQLFKESICIIFGNRNRFWLASDTKKDF